MYTDLIIDPRYNLLPNFSLYREISLAAHAVKSSCLVPASEFPQYKMSSATFQNSYAGTLFNVTMDVVYRETETINAPLLFNGPAVTDKMTEESA